MNRDFTHDLVVLVPDKHIEHAVRGLLARPESLGMRRLAPNRVAFHVHPERDPGVFHTGAELLAGFAHDARHALVVLDQMWSGAPTNRAEELERLIETRLEPTWATRARCVCISPEVEVWVWSDSPHVAKELGWENPEQLYEWLTRRGLWSKERSAKPDDPKKAFEAATREKAVPRSSAIFEKLATKVSLERCTDRAFIRLRGTLREWFPSQNL